MKLGLNVPNLGPDTEPESLAAWVRFADGAGFDLAMMSDHVAITPDVAAIYPPPFFEPFTTLAWLAGITERVGLGTSVTWTPTPTIPRSSGRQSTTGGREAVAEQARKLGLAELE